MAADDFRADPRTEQERQLLDVVRRYLHAYNTDVERLVRDVCPHDVDPYMTGGEIHGKDQLLLDPSRWPGIAPAAPPATAGGPGKPRGARA